MFTKGQSSELARVTSSNISSPLYLFLKVLPPVYTVVKLSQLDGRYAACFYGLVRIGPQVKWELPTQMLR